MQKVIYALKDGATHLIRGDSDAERIKGQETGALPYFLKDGWKIKAIHMTASAAVNPDQVLGIIILER